MYVTKKKDIKFWAQELDKLTLESSSFPLVVLIASDASIKNNVTTSIVHIHMVDKPLMKTIHHAVNVTSTEAKLFAIRCGINQLICFDNISKIVVITDSIHIAQKIFQTSVTFLIDAITTLLNSGNVQAILSGIFMVKLTKRPSSLILYYYFHARIHEILTRKTKVMSSSKLGRWCFKLLILKRIT